MEGDSSSSGPALEFRHVTVELGDKEVLSDVSFSLDRGQMIVVTGCSGSGKSVSSLAMMGLLPGPLMRSAGGTSEISPTS